VCAKGHLCSSGYIASLVCRTKAISLLVSLRSAQGKKQKTVVFDKIWGNLRQKIDNKKIDILAECSQKSITKNIDIFEKINI